MNALVILEAIEYVRQRGNYNMITEYDAVFEEVRRVLRDEWNEKSAFVEVTGLGAEALLRTNIRMTDGEREAATRRLCTRLERC